MTSSDVQRIRRQRVSNSGALTSDSLTADDGRGNDFTFRRHNGEWFHEYTRDMGGLRNGTGLVIDQTLASRLDTALRGLR